MVLIVTGLIVVFLFEDISNFLEWTGTYGGLDWIEDHLQVFKAILFGVLFYVIVQCDLLKKVQESAAEEVKSKKEKEVLYKSLEIKNRELQSIVSIASHDLKSPLVNILGFNGELDRACISIDQILSQSPPSELPQQICSTMKDIREARYFIQAGAEKMQSLVDGLLKVSRVGTAELTIQQIEIEPMLHQIVKTMQYQILKAGAEVDIGPLPPCLGDFGQLNHVFSNLLDNALKYRDSSRPLRVLVEGKRLNSVCEYRISDNGLGIPEDQKTEIFNIFYRLSPDGAVEGEGLGLTIVMRILERLNGAIALESQVGQGSTFIVTLPSCNNQ